MCHTDDCGTLEAGSGDAECGGLGGPLVGVLPARLPTILSRLVRKVGGLRDGSRSGASSLMALFASSKVKALLLA